MEETRNGRHEGEVWRRLGMDDVEASNGRRKAKKLRLGMDDVEASNGRRKAYRNGRKWRLGMDELEVLNRRDEMDERRQRLRIDDKRGRLGMIGTIAKNRRYGG
jgi:hypothetical protein